MSVQIIPLHFSPTKMNPEITKIIDQYLAGELSKKDLAAFEERLKSNPKLQEEVALQQDVIAGIKRSAQRIKIKQTRRNYFRSRLLKWGVISMSSIALVGLVTYLAVSMLSSKIEPLSEELMNQLDKDAQFDQIQAQYFQIPEEGGIVMSEKGVLLSIPKNAFLQNGKPYNGEAVVQFQEAMDAEDIVTSGLSTMSGDRLLETQGMFSLRSYTKNGKELEINPDVGVYAQAPFDKAKSGMQLFSGEKDAGGNIDWQNPEPLYKLPLPVDMSELDFYPSEFEPYLDKLKWNKSKKSRDSLYLSFEEYYNEYSEYPFTEGSLPSRKITSEECAYLYNDNRPIDKLMTEEEAIRLSKWEGNPRHEEFEGFRRDFSEINSRDEDYNFNYEVGELTVYYDSLEDVDVVATSAEAASNDMCYILPSKVLGFWNKKFNNTNLATRAFEKRMRSIHPTCNRVVLNKYVSQLDKPLSEIDKEVVAMGYSEFEKFAAENIGKIDVNNPHLENLQNFYSKAIDQLKEKSKKNQNKEKKHRKKWDKETQESRKKENKQRVYRETQSLNEEYQFNMRNVERQIGSSVGFTIKKAGGTVYNIDKYVWDATVNRESMDRIDPVSGKRVKITYNDFTFNVSNHDKYLKLYAYVFPHELNSYQRIEGKNGQFSYPLNDDIIYDIGVVGITENGYEYYQKQTFKEGELGDISLKKVSEEQMKSSIKQLNKKRKGKTMPIGDEVQWLIRERKDYKEQKLRKEMEVFRRELSKVVFPCVYLKKTLYFLNLIKE